MPTPTETAAKRLLQCDAPGCDLEMIHRQGGVQYCFKHAMEVGNAERVANGFPPITFDEKGGRHVIQ